MSLPELSIFEWAKVVGVTTIFALLVCYVACVPRYGFLGAGDRIYSVFVSAVGDLAFLSPRRTLAMAWLAVKESVRRQAVAGLILFLLVLAFALWFLDPETIDPSALYVTFVLSAVNYVILLMAVVTSSFSLPNDLRNRTIYTIVTKPVRPSEVILGRMLGFTIVCSVPLAIMGLSGYFFIVRALDHTHELTEGDLRSVAAAEATIAGLPPGSKEGTTSTERNHSHRVIVDSQGSGVTEMSDSSKIAFDESANFMERFGQSHRHRVTAAERDGKLVYAVGPPEGQLHARVPIMGTLMFRGIDGQLTERGMNVGNWTKREYVAGGTLAAAVYRFADVTEADIPDRLRLQMGIPRYRTTKEGLNRPVLGSLTVRNPLTGLAGTPRNFAAREYYTLEQFIPRKLTDSSGRPLDLFRDLVNDGRVEIELQCIPRSQFFGVGPSDVYLLAREGRFDVNFAKAFLGIWLQMALTVVIGVVWSTFLSGPVAMLATALTIILAVMKPTVLTVLRGMIFGDNFHSGGMIESIIRLGQQKNVVEELDAGATTEVILLVDKTVSAVVEQMLRFVPDFSAMSDIQTVARGFDVAPALLTHHLLQSAGFALPLFLVGYLIFKLTEVAK